MKRITAPSARRLPQGKRRKWMLTNKPIEELRKQARKAGWTEVDSFVSQETLDQMTEAMRLGPWGSGK